MNKCITNARDWLHDTCPSGIQALPKCLIKYLHASPQEAMSLFKSGERRGQISLTLWYFMSSNIRHVQRH